LRAIQRGCTCHVTGQVIVFIVKGFEIDLLTSIKENFSFLRGERKAPAKPSLIISTFIGDGNFLKA
jgi:hypothetical protein